VGIAIHVGTAALGCPSTAGRTSVYFVNVIVTGTVSLYGQITTLVDVL
jgi:hypothetical protein